MGRRLEAVIFVEDAVEEDVVVGGGAAGCSMGMVGSGRRGEGGGLWIVQGVGLARGGGEGGGCVVVLICGCGCVGECFALEGFVGGGVGCC